MSNNNFLRNKNNQFKRRTFRKTKVCTVKKNIENEMNLLKKEKKVSVKIGMKIEKPKLSSIFSKVTMNVLTMSSLKEQGFSFEK